MFNYVPLLGKRFREGERGPEHFDCYGLLMECYRLDRKQALPSYPNHGNPEGNWDEAERAKAGEWERLAGISARCAVTFKLKTRDRVTGKVKDHFHTGYMLDLDRFIHIMQGREVAVESIRSPLWKGALDGFFQWRPRSADTDRASVSTESR